MINRLTNLAKSLRKKSTYVETILWNKLRSRQIEGIKFRRQQPVGDFIVDFISFEKRIVIELDGGQHAENRDKDIDRDRFLTKNGFKVLRFWNTEVIEHIDGVLEVIRDECLK